MIPVLDGYDARFSRARVLFILFFAVFAGLIFRLYYLQCICSNRFRDLSLSQHVKKLTLPSRRGSIRDVDGNLLAVSVQRDSVYVDPSMVPDDEAEGTSRRLAAILGLDPRGLHDRILRAKTAKPKKRFLWVARKADPQLAALVEQSDLAGVGLVSEYKRLYPQESSGCHVIGFVGMDNNGLSGVELAYEEYLHGTDGFKNVERDGAGNARFSTKLQTVSPIPGFDIELTINVFAQHTVEEVLTQVQEEYSPVSASVVVMDPRTGAILAMANRPGFNPNSFGDFPEEMYRNRAVTDYYEPGSVMKPFTMSAAIEANLIEPQTKIFCENGLYRVQKRLFHDHHPYGWLTATGVIRHSSNVGAAKIGQMCGPDLLYETLKAFGFGEKTGVDLPGEVPGMLAPPSSWTKYSTVSIAVGQEMAATPLQLASAFSVIANGGVRLRPYVVSRIIDPEGRPAKSFGPHVLERTTSYETAFGKMVPILSEVVERGTGKRARSVFYTLAGKTGTAQKPNETGGYSHSKFISSFCAFGPAEDPRICVVVMINEVAPGKPYYGGTVAAPVAGKILEKTLRYMGVAGTASGKRKSPGAA